VLLPWLVATLPAGRWLRGHADVSLADVGAKLLLERAHDAEGFNQLFGFVQTAVPLGLTGDGFAVLLSARQLALVPIVPGRVEAKLQVFQNFIQGVRMAGRLLADVQMH